MAATDHTIAVLRADDRGIPTAARCAQCGWTWQRPAGDDYADTLATEARQHRPAAV